MSHSRFDLMLRTVVEATQCAAVRTMFVFVFWLVTDQRSGRYSKLKHLMLRAVVEATQCAAVRTCEASSNDPPQNSPPFDLRAT